MIIDHSATARVILRDEGTLIKLPIRLLLPLPYRR
jgi:hypothetical protein